MSSLRQNFRPKHQVLVLKCYPKFQKNAASVKPNPSELSYLLFYTTTRRSKVQQVVEFLEKKTSSDVGKKRIGDVQVTLQIIKALMEKSPRDLPLYAASVVRIFSTILRSNDVSMAEETIPAFETFCVNYDGSFVPADPDFLPQYEALVQTYADFASRPADLTKGQFNAPLTMRWRDIGLQGIKRVTMSDLLGLNGGRIFRVIIPVILQNVYSTEDDHLQVLQQRSQSESYVDEEKGLGLALKRRTSNATVQTYETNEAQRVPTLSATTADADKLAEDDLGILALQSLKQIFTVNVQGQVKPAMDAALTFILNTIPPRRNQSEKSPGHDANARWAATLVEMIARWTPVQDRYIILVTAMDTLVQSPVEDDRLEQHLTLATLIGWLLSSDVNLIGLSVMDVLLGLVQHILVLLQLGGYESTVQPHLQQTDAVGAEVSLDRGSKQRAAADDGARTRPAEITSVPTALRLQLLAQLKACTGDLATHIYYSDQISDMVSAILKRLKPSVLSNVGTAVSAIENPAAAAQSILDSAQLQEIPNTHDFFSFDTARTTALKSIKEVLLVANMKGSTNGAASAGRNRVGVQVWEGTQWLLRDPDGRVRKAYVDALLTWLDLEVSRDDLRALEDSSLTSRGAGAKEREDLSGAHLKHRIVSTASIRERIRPQKSTFLPLLHLAIYENAMDHAGSESDVLITHLLLTVLVNKLGVNAVKEGLPMVMRLQEEIQAVDSPVAKVRLGSLVHGYFWAVSFKFDFDMSTVGRAIQSEIGRRKRRGMWMDKVAVPPLQLNKIHAPGKTAEPGDDVSTETASNEFLKPFDARSEFVERVAVAYAESFIPPPVSPPSSPSRRLTVTSLNTTAVSTPPDDEHRLPERIREQMLSIWDKDVIITLCEKEKSRTVSLNGSRTGTSGRRNLLAVNGVGDVSSSLGSGANSPKRRYDLHHQHQHASHHQQSTSPLGPHGLGGLRRLRQESLHAESSTGVGSSRASSVVRVEDLKRYLAGEIGNIKDASIDMMIGRNRRLSQDSSSESMMSVDYAQSEMYAPHDRGSIADSVSNNGNNPNLVDAGTARQGDIESVQHGAERRSTASSIHGNGRSEEDGTATASGSASGAGAGAGATAVTATSADHNDVDDAPPVPLFPYPIPGDFPQSSAATPTTRQASVTSFTLPAAASSSSRGGRILDTERSTAATVSKTGGPTETEPASSSSPPLSSFPPSRDDDAIAEARLHGGFAIEGRDATRASTLSSGRSRRRRQQQRRSLAVDELLENIMSRHPPNKDRPRTRGGIGRPPY